MNALDNRKLLTVPILDASLSDQLMEAVANASAHPVPHTLGGLYRRYAQALSSSVVWNLTLLTLGSVISAFAINAFAVPNGFIGGGLSGLALLLNNFHDGLSVGEIYFLLNIPLMFLGWMLISRRFILYTLYGMVCLSVSLVVVQFPVHLEDKFLAALAFGAVSGIGWGFGLRSLGSLGGMDVVGLILHRRYNVSIGTVNSVFSAAVFLAGLVFLDVSLVLYSLASVFVASWVLDYSLGMFARKKVLLIVSNNSDAICSMIGDKLHRGCTLLQGKGGFTGTDRQVLLTVISTMQVKQLEDAVYEIDPKSFVITLNALNVLGEGFSMRKCY